MLDSPLKMDYNIKSPINLDRKENYMETTTKTVSQRIKEQRLASSLTQTELGEKVGKSKQWVSELERGHIKLSFEMAVTLSKLFGKTPDFFCK